MQTQNFGRFFAGIIGVLLALLVAINVFTSGANVLAQSFRYLTPIALVVGITNPRFAMIVMLLAGAYLDEVKRLMILDTRFSNVDLAFLLGFSPALMGGVVLGILLSWVTGKKSYSRREVWLFLLITVFGVVMGCAYLMIGEGMRSLGDAVNVAAYNYLFLAIPMFYQSRKEVIGLLKNAMIIYLPAALWAIKQGEWGLAGFELDYIEAGYSIESRQLGELVFRNMGTMVSAAVLSMIASLMAAALLIPVQWKKERLSFRAWLSPIRWLVIVGYILAAKYTYSRTGWVCGGLAIGAFLVLGSRFLTYGGITSALVALALLYANAGRLEESKVLNRWQDYLFENVAQTDEQKQAMVIGTLAGRLESMAQFTENSEIWTPFGLKIAHKTQVTEGLWIHDALTEALVMVGYVPLTILILGVLFVLWKVLRSFFSMENGPDRLFVRYYLALGGAMLFTGLSHGKSLFVFPTNFFWCMFFSSAYAMYLLHQRSSAVAIAPQKQAVPQRSFSKYRMTPSASPTSR